MTRIISLILVVFLVVSCGSSNSVYQLPEAQQQGLTFQTYQQSPDEAYEAVNQVIKNYKSKMLMQEGWEIESSDKQARTIETNWRKAGGSGSVSGGRTMGSSNDERYRLSVKITEAGSGSKVALKLQKQVRMSQWRTFKVKKKTAQNHLQSIFERLEREYLTSQS